MVGPGRGLYNGETLTIPLTFSSGAGTATRGTDYTLACDSATGVVCSNLGSGNAKVVFTGPSTGGATATQVTITMTAVSDGTAEAGGETVDIGLGAMTLTGSGGGVTGVDGFGKFWIADPNEPIVSIQPANPSEVSITEGANAVFEVNYSGLASTMPFVVKLHVDDASGSSDFVASGQEGDKTFTIPANRVSANYTIPTVDDNTAEPDGKVKLTVRPDTNYVPSGFQEDLQTLLVKDNDGTPTAPSKPTGFTATAGNAQVVLAWSNPNNSAITKYQVQQKASSGNYGSWTDIGSSTATTVSHTVTGLTNGTVYKFRIRAVAGTNTYDAQSDEVTATPSATVVTIAPKTNTNPVTEGTAAVFTVTRTGGATTNALTVKLHVDDAANSDFVATANEEDKTVTIAAGSSTADYSVPTSGDNIDEPNGPVKVTVLTGTGYGVSSPSSATRTVNAAAATVTLTGSNAAVTEGNRKTFTLSIGRGLYKDEELSIPLTFSGTATRGTDYTLSCGSATGVVCSNLDSGTATVVFDGPNTGATARSVTINLTARDDGTAESGGETVDIGVGTVSPTGLGGGAATPADNFSQFTVNDASGVGGGGGGNTGGGGGTPSPTVSISGGNPVSEGDAAVFTVRRSGAVTSALTVLLTVSENEAEGRDFVTPANQGNQQVVIPAGATTATYRVSTDDDAVDEPDGAVTVALRSSTAYDHGATATATVVVTDNDEPSADAPVVSISGGSAVTEGEAAVFTVSATPTPRSTITVNVDVVESGSFVASGQSGGRTVTIGAEGTASLRVATEDDKAYEPAGGSITATVGAGSGYAPHSSDATAVVRVSDNDRAGLLLSTSRLRMGKGGSASYTVALSSQPPAGEDVTVRISSQQGTGLTVDTDATMAGNQNTVTFTSSNWNTPQRVMVTAPQRAVSGRLS
ncbi:MAG: hypothetical protein F4026_05320, partial [Synechococcus sp. SB0669_bin_8]|nr:hypothetical protein [Synechococcus sp. SB0669_bin_8]